GVQVSDIVWSFFFQAEDGIRDFHVTGVQTCALPIYGAVHVFGFPISEEFEEGGYNVQYFERARMEWHPENAGTPYVVLLGHLGRSEERRVGRESRSRRAAEQVAINNYIKV